MKIRHNRAHRLWASCSEFINMRFHEASIVYPRDATLARYYLWPCVCPYLIIASRCSVKTSERIELVFSKEASFDISRF